MAASFPNQFLEGWLSDLLTNDRASGTIRRYKSAIENFLSWY